MSFIPGGGIYPTFGSSITEVNGVAPIVATTVAGVVSVSTTATTSSIVSGTNISSSTTAGATTVNVIASPTFAGTVQALNMTATGDMTAGRFLSENSGANDIGWRITNGGGSEIIQISNDALGRMTMTGSFDGPPTFLLNPRTGGILASGFTDGTATMSGGSIVGAVNITATGAYLGNGNIRSAGGNIEGINLNDGRNGTGQGTANYILQAVGGGGGYRWIPPPITNYFSLPTDATIGTTPNTTITATSTYPLATWNAGMLIQGTCYFSGTADRTINHTIAYAQVVLYRGTDSGTILTTHRASCPPNTGGTATVEYWSCPIIFYDTGASTVAPQQYTLSITFVQSTGPVLNPLLLSNSTLCVLNGQ